jgi:MFS family permease
MDSEQSCQTLVLVLVSICSSFSITVTSTQQLTPYSSQMIIDFGLAKDRDGTSFYVGLLSSLGLLGGTFGGLFSGILADKYGRKTVLAVNCFCMAVISAVFGLARSYVWALVCRFLLGLLTATASSAKASLAELLPEKLQAQAMSMYSTGIQIGQLLGALAGGFLSHPDHTGLLSKGIFVTFPYLLPNFIVFGLSGLCFILVILFLKESLQLPSNRRPVKFLEVLKQSPNIGYLLALIAVSSFADSWMTELMNFWMWAKREHGGLELDPRDIGVYLGIVSLLTSSILVVMYRRLVDFKGVLWTCRVGLLMLAFACLLIPNFSYLPNAGLAALSCLMLYISLSIQVFCSLFILINNAVNAETRGMFNGLSLLVSCAARAIGPTASGALFSWSLRIDCFPVDYRFSFIVASGVFCLAFALSRRLTTELEHPAVYYIQDLEGLDEIYLPLRAK